MQPQIQDRADKSEAALVKLGERMSPVSPAVPSPSGDSEALSKQALKKIPKSLSDSQTSAYSGSKQPCQYYPLSAFLTLQSLNILPEDAYRPSDLPNVHRWLLN